MANVNRAQTWRVEGTVPHTWPGRKEESTRNVNLMVVADDLESAVAAVRAQHPRFRFVKVMGDRFIEDVVFAERA